MDVWLFRVRVAFASPSLSEPQQLRSLAAEKKLSCHMDFNGRKVIVETQASGECDSQETFIYRLQSPSLPELLAALATQPVTFHLMPAGTANESTPVEHYAYCEATTNVAYIAERSGDIFTLPLKYVGATTTDAAIGELSLRIFFEQVVDVVIHLKELCVTCLSDGMYRVHCKLSPFKEGTASKAVVASSGTAKWTSEHVPKSKYRGPLRSLLNHRFVISVLMQSIGDEETSVARFLVDLTNMAEDASSQVIQFSLKDSETSISAEGTLQLDDLPLFEPELRRIIGSSVLQSQGDEGAEEKEINTEKNSASVAGWDSPANKVNEKHNMDATTSVPEKKLGPLSQAFSSTTTPSTDAFQKHTQLKYTGSSNENEGSKQPHEDSVPKGQPKLSNIHYRIDEPSPLELSDGDVPPDTVPPPLELSDGDVPPDTVPPPLELSDGDVPPDTVPPPLELSDGDVPPDTVPPPLELSDGDVPPDTVPPPLELSDGDVPPDTVPPPLELSDGDVPPDTVPPPLELSDGDVPPDTVPPPLELSDGDVPPDTVPPPLELSDGDVPPDTVPPPLELSDGDVPPDTVPPPLELSDGDVPPDTVPPPLELSDGDVPPDTVPPPLELSDGDVPPDTVPPPLELSDGDVPPDTVPPPLELSDGDVPPDTVPPPLELSDGDVPPDTVPPPLELSDGDVPPDTVPPPLELSDGDVPPDTVPPPLELSDGDVPPDTVPPPLELSDGDVPPDTVPPPLELSDGDVPPDTVPPPLELSDGDVPPDTVPPPLELSDGDVPPDTVPPPLELSDGDVPPDTVPPPLELSDGDVPPDTVPPPLELSDGDVPPDTVPPPLELSDGDTEACTLQESVKEHSIVHGQEVMDAVLEGPQGGSESDTVSAACKDLSLCGPGDDVPTASIVTCVGTGSSAASTTHVNPVAHPESVCAGADSGSGVQGIISKDVDDEILFSDPGEQLMKALAHETKCVESLVRSMKKMDTVARCVQGAYCDEVDRLLTQFAELEEADEALTRLINETTERLNLCLEKRCQSQVGLLETRLRVEAYGSALSILDMHMKTQFSFCGNDTPVGDSTSRSDAPGRS